MIGIVVVSHSRALADAAVELAYEMVPASARPPVRVAAGLDETTFGTDAVAIADAIMAVDSPDGVLVLVDLGSAVLSAQMALEFVDPSVAAHTVVSPGALVEGLIAALVTASTGAALGVVLDEAAAGLLGKQEQLAATLGNDDMSPSSGDFGQGPSSGFIGHQLSGTSSDDIGGTTPCLGGTPPRVLGESGSADSSNLRDSPADVGRPPAGRGRTGPSAGTGDEGGVATGAVTGAVAGTALGGALGAESDLVPGELYFVWTVRNAHGLHARPAAGLVAGLRGIDAEVFVRNVTAGRGPVSAASLTRLQTLGLRAGDQMEVRIIGAQASLAYDTVARLAEGDFGESVEGTGSSTVPSGGSVDGAGGPRDSAQAAAPLEPASPESGDSGNSPAPGGCSSPTPGLVDSSSSTGAPPVRTGREIVVGPAWHSVAAPDVARYQPGDSATEVRRIDEAAARVRVALHQLGQGPSAAIFEVQELMLSDAEAPLREDCSHGETAVMAVQSYCDDMACQLDALDDPYLRARAEDQRGLQRMMLRALMGMDIVGEQGHGILILDELDPATAASLDPQTCQGIVTISGGATGHGALMALARGFTLLTGQSDAASIPDGTLIAIDPVESRLWIDPSPDEIARLELAQAERRTAEQEAQAHAHEPAITESGTRILVEANLSSVPDAATACEAGADGSGLVRTEVLFASWDHAPTAEEQADIFIRIGQALGGRPITIRTWDPGGDKPLPFLAQDPEPNPMLGERGIRAMQRLPALLDEQLAGVLLASRVVNVRVMFPMITVPEEMTWARSRLAEVERTLAERVGSGDMSAGHDGTADDGPADNPTTAEPTPPRNDPADTAPTPLPNTPTDAAPVPLPNDPTAPTPTPLPVGMMVETPSAALCAADYLDVADFISIGTNDLTQYTMAVDRGNPQVAHVANGSNTAVWRLIEVAARAFAGRPVAVCGDLASHPEAVSRLIGMGVTELSVRPPLVGVIKQVVRQGA